MPQTKIIIDSNTYFRLAKSIHPLLFQVFGAQNYCLYVLAELQHEYDKSPRLLAKFPWVDMEEFKRNRSSPLTLSKKQKHDISITFDIIWDYRLLQVPGPSRVDVIILTYAYVLKIPVVTDDADIQTLATMFDIGTMRTLALLKLMLDCHHIEIVKVRETVSYWLYINDLPGDYKIDYERLFGESAPFKSK